VVVVAILASMLAVGFGAPLKSEHVVHRLEVLPVYLGRARRVAVALCVLPPRG
jgi:hypothetical protein